jgi:hypothetical protein
MSLFARWFRKPPLGSTAPAPPSAPSAARSASDHAARLEAIAHLSDGETLRGLAGVARTDGSRAAPAAAFERAAQARLAALIDAGAIDFAAFCREGTDRSAMLRTALLCADPSRPAQALATIDDPSELVQLVLRSPSSRVRQLAAERITDPKQLRDTLKQVRDKDKSVYKILKQKCDVLNAEERKAAAIAAEIEAVCASLERHSLRPYEPQYATVLEYHSNRWRALPTEPAADVAARAEQAIARGREVIAAHHRKLELQAAEAAARAAAHAAAREADEQAELAEREAALARSQADAVLREETAAVREAEERARRAARAAEEQSLRQIGGLLRAAKGALDDGNTQRAAGLRRAIAEKVAATNLPAHLSRQLLELDDKLNELKQWKDYAVAPKRIELIAEMESLIGAEEEPKVLAARIKALQQEWRTISKGIVSDTPDDWERFHRAAQAAYEPCREYFAAQAQLRRDNLQQRKALLERLAAFDAAQNPENLDGRLLAKVLREAVQEWRGYFPVDREPNRPIQQEFDRSLARLQALLDGWYQSNAEAKQLLIAGARRLLAQADSREAIEAVKRLQMQWKTTGAARRDQDQSLWSEFRELCDGIFKKRQQAYEEYQAGLETNKRQAVALCEEAERAATASGAELIAAGANIPEWRAAFDALDEMPRNDARELRERFERAVETCIARANQERAREAEQAFTNLFEAARLIQAYAWAVAAEAEPAEQSARREAAESFIASTDHWPRGALPAVKESLSTAAAPSTTDPAAREQTLRTLCIRCEILSESPTPPEDQALRREFQVQRLMQSMGQGGHARAEHWESLALEWVRSAAVNPAIYESCRTRFLRCWTRRH